MLDVSVEVHGDVALRQSLRDAAGDIQELTGVNRRIAQMVLTVARANAPKKTGRLARSLRASADEAHVQISSNLIYAGVIHFGWPGHNIRAQPFATRAAETTEPRWTRMYEQAAQDVCDEVAREARGVGP